MDTDPMTTSYTSTVTFSLLTLVAVLIAAYYYIETSRAVRFIKKLPGPSPIPIVGHGLIPLTWSPELMVEKSIELYEKYGSTGGAYFGTKTVAFVSDPQDIEIILSSSTHIDKAEEYKFFKPWLGDGLLITKGDKWRRHRKVIAPTFHMNILKTFVPLFYENSIDLVNRLRDKVGKEFDCHDYLSAVTVDILTETAMGVKEEKRQKTGYEYAMAVMKLSDIIHRRHYNIFLRYDMLFKYSKFAKVQEKLLHIVHTLTEHVIKEKAKDVEEKLIVKDQQVKEVQNDKPMENLNVTENTKSANNRPANYIHYVRDDLDDIDENDVGEKKRHAFLEMMLELKKNGQMTDEEIWEEVNTIMFEGHDTTAAGSSFALCVLGNHPDVQARVHEELDTIFGDSDRQCTFQDTLKMKYLERVIMETLRLFPPVPWIARHLNKDVKIVTGDYILPKSTTVLIVQFITHRLEKYYPNPTVFNPDNFLPERTQPRHSYAYIPFSAGPRSCVGRKYAMLKLKVLLSTILRNYRIISDTPDKDFHLRGDIILKRHDGFKIKIEPRKPSIS